MDIPFPPVVPGSPVAHPANAISSSQVVILDIWGMVIAPKMDLSIQ
jgi:hypothetical protein